MSRAQEEIDAIPGRRLEHLISGEFSMTPGAPVLRSLVRGLISQDGPWIFCGLGLRLKGFLREEEELLLDYFAVEVVDAGSQRRLGDYPGHLLSTFRLPEDEDFQPGYRLIEPISLVPNSILELHTSTTRELPLDKVDCWITAFGYRIVNF